MRMTRWSVRRPLARTRAARAPMNETRLRHVSKDKEEERARTTVGTTKDDYVFHKVRGIEEGTRKGSVEQEGEEDGDTFWRSDICPALPYLIYAGCPCVHTPCSETNKTSLFSPSTHRTIHRRFPHSTPTFLLFSAIISTESVVDDELCRVELFYLIIPSSNQIIRRSSISTYLPLHFEIRFTPKLRNVLAGTYSCQLAN